MLNPGPALNVDIVRVCPTCKLPQQTYPYAHPEPLWTEHIDPQSGNACPNSLRPCGDAPLTSVLPQETTSPAAAYSPAHRNQPADPDETHWRHNGWRHARRRVLQALALIDGRGREYDAVLHCGARAWVEQSTDHPIRYRVACQQCHSRWCLPCAQWRSHVIRTNLQALCKDAIAAHLSRVPLRFITLTLRSGPDEPLAELLERLATAWTKLRRCRAWKATQRGGAAVCELRYYPAKRRWHPHLHVIADGDYIPHETIRAEWLKATGTSTIVDVRAVRSDSNAAAYVTDYLRKPIPRDFLDDPDRLQEAMIAMHGRKLVATYGTWARHKLTDYEPEHDYTPVAPLVELMHRADNGDRYAMLVLQQLRDHGRERPRDNPPDTLLFDDTT
jgi:hypothetical protein